MDLESRKHLPLFPIGIVEKLTGLTARQIRYYEQHGLVVPTRSDGNQRVFSFVDAERLILIRSLLDEGLNMNQVKTRINRMEQAPNAKPARQAELTDSEVYQKMRADMLDSPGRPGTSEFRGDLFRFYRRH